MVKKKVAIFPVRCQPPHICHILTIIKLLDIYKKVIVHVVNVASPYYSDEHFIMNPSEVVKVLKTIFQYMPQVSIISGSHLRDRTNFDDLPPFDDIVAGNPEFIKTMQKKRSVKVIPRSKIAGYDLKGTLIREIIRKGRSEGQKYPIKTLKPWGYEIILGEWQGWRVKILHMKKGHRTSKHRHVKRVEYHFLPNNIVHLRESNELHRCLDLSKSDKDFVFLEVTNGSEEDIIRVEDDYGRANHER